MIHDFRPPEEPDASWLAIRQLERMSGAEGGAGLFEASRSLMVTTTVITVAIGFGLALFLARLIADPLEKLGTLAEEVSKGLSWAVYGLILILVIYVMPAGAAGFARQIGAWARRM